MPWGEQRVLLSPVTNEREKIWMKAPLGRAILMP